ncbi:MAG: hypothetical protein EBT06_10520 [Gammaproteobacteria bacterium]|nr:hypothetical protein [Gammaproteobacteria bacterium]NBT45331.1 hypothetical protein [Gammaproteobacteria bacterium]NBY22853.1 hypothetical protein [Gammaproteobacteria bacterium]NDE35525.1 hypothetical protein [Gammaproteobacteria bacterium]NDE57038.1 hypothetical protein [Gammaproteobacteria bacterium]
MKTQTNYRPRKKTQPPAEPPALDVGISIGQATALLASRCKPEWENERAYKNKVRGRIDYAIERHKLVVRDKKIRFGDFIEWARQEADWSVGLADISVGVDHPLNCNLRPSSSFQATLTLLPNSLSDCQDALSEAMARIKNLEQEISVYQRFCAEYLPCIETGLKLRRRRHLIPNVQNFCRGVAG